LSKSARTIEMTLSDPQGPYSRTSSAILEIVTLVDDQT
jgi:hypothetical protein